MQQGLGGCYEITNLSTTQDELDALGDLYAQEDCSMGVCDCGSPPDAVERGPALGGTCVAVGAPGSPCGVDADCDAGLVCSCFNDGCNDCGAERLGTCEEARVVAEFALAGLRLRGCRARGTRRAGARATGTAAWGAGALATAAPDELFAVNAMRCAPDRSRARAR